MKLLPLLAAAVALVVPANAFGQAETPSPGAAITCTITGTAKSETLRGTRGDDVICARGGADIVRGGPGDDTILGGGGSDSLLGGGGSDVLSGGRGSDTLRGGDGHDNLRARDGKRDLVFGGRGRDVGALDKRDRVRGVEKRAPQASTPPVPGGADVSKGATAASQEAVLQYWTPANLAGAKPISSGADFGGASARPLFHIDNEGVFPYWESGYLPAGSYSPAVGRLYYTTPNGAFRGTCSATVVARNLLLTAAHCVYDLNGQNQGTCVKGLDCLMRNFEFIPAQFGDQAPYGKWAGDSATLYNAYFENGTPFRPLDYAFVFMNWPDQTGRLIGDYTGWFEIAWNSPGGAKYSEGYPAEGWFLPYCPANDATNSCYAYYNYAPVGAYAQVAPGWYEEGIGGFSNGGASGGPIFEVINGAWHVTSVISHGNPSRIYTYSGCGDPVCRWYGENFWGPYFNSWVGDLYRQHALR